MADGILDGRLLLVPHEKCYGFFHSNWRLNVYCQSSSNCLHINGESLVFVARNISEKGRIADGGRLLWLPFLIRTSGKMWIWQPSMLGCIKYEVWMLCGCVRHDNKVTKKGLLLFYDIIRKGPKAGLGYWYIYIELLQSQMNTFHLSIYHLVPGRGGDTQWRVWLITFNCHLLMSGVICIHTVSDVAWIRF